MCVRTMHVGAPAPLACVSTAFLCADPHEAECLFAPLAGLEVRSTRVEGRVLVVEVRANINLNALTIEQVIAKRHRLITNMAEGIEFELLEDLTREG